MELPTNVHVENVRPPQTNFNPNYNPFGASSYKRPNLDWEQLYGDFDKKDEPISSAIDWESNTDLPITPSFTHREQQQVIENLETRAENYQYKNRYILTGIKSGILMIDQHRAHTRILFDLFLNQIENSQGASQQVLFPELLELSADDTMFFEHILSDLQRIGFEFEKLENNSYSIKGVSSHVGTGSVIDLLLEILSKAKTTALVPTARIHETIALTMAETASLKSGQRLSTEEMSDLIDRLFACANHNFTPDGKKIMSIFTLDELEKRF